MSGRLPPSSQDPSFSSTNSNSSSSNPSSTARASRSQQPPWQGSANRQFARRGLTPISTPSSGQPLPSSATSSPSRAAFSPTRPDSNQLATAVNRQVASRQSSSSSTHSFGGIPAAGQQHQHHASAPFHSGSRARTVTSSSSPRVTSPIASVSSLSQAGSAVLGTSRLARHSPSVSQSAAGSPVSASAPQSASGSSGQLTSLVVTQLNILLSTIKDDGDSAKWQAQVDKIHRLVEDNGMEVFPQFFRRLLQNNAAAIFPGSGRQDTATAGNYQLLVQEMQKITIEAPQATKIAEALDTSDGDLFRDFDLYTFMDHFRLDPVARVTLALACRKVSKADLRSKGRLPFLIHRLRNLH